MKTSYTCQHARSNPLADAKARLNIHVLWNHFSFTGNPAASCRCPWREDHKPSFSVNADGTLFNDFSTGEAGDAVDFLQRASGLSKKDACRKFIELAGGQVTHTPRAARQQCQQAEAKHKPAFPDFMPGTAEDIQHLASIRSIGREGLEFACERGLVHFATLKDCPAWIITDSERVNAQARRMDGQPHPETGHGPNVWYDEQNVPHDILPAQGWQHLEGKPKVWTLPGSWASWPIGIKEAQPFKHIALCEGGPDFLAAHHIALKEQASHHTKRDVSCVPVAMLGASLKIHPDALPLFAGKRVRIFGHDDEAGRGAVERWAAQLASVGADVDAFKFEGLVQADGKPVNDLNDSLLMDAASLARVERMLPL